MNKEEIMQLIEQYSNEFQFISPQLKEQVVVLCLQENMPKEELEKKLTRMRNIIEKCEEIIRRDIPKTVTDKSIIFIGPMCAGKSTISKLISEKIKMPLISLDSREQLAEYYNKIGSINGFKLQELALVGYVLSELKEPSIINFGAGHSIQENLIYRMELQKMMSKFKNVVLIEPSRNPEISEKILTERIRLREHYNANPNKIKQNKHFINCGYNEQLASYVYETEEKTIGECVDEIIGIVSRDSIENNIKL